MQVYPGELCGPGTGADLALPDLRELADHPRQGGDRGVQGGDRLWSVLLQLQQKIAPAAQVSSEE